MEDYIQEDDYPRIPPAGHCFDLDLTFDRIQETEKIPGNLRESKRSRH